MQSWMWLASEGLEEIPLLAGTPTPLGLIKSFFANVKFVFFGGTKNLGHLPIVLKQYFTLLNNPTVLGAAIVMVFGWWGVRKVIKMIFRALRKGQINA